MVALVQNEINAIKDVIKLQLLDMGES